MQKIVYFLSLLVFLSGSVIYGQVNEENVEKYGSGKVFRNVDSPASFPGGPEAMREFFKLYFDAYVEQGNALESAIEGYVEARFIVEPNGKIKYVEIIKSYTQAYDEEMIRTIKRMPKWTPAMVDGKPVRSFQLISTV
ncbi:MAG: energy transducer TonB [Cytophagaceae bacterium]